jgi:hypothetical protein
MTHGCLVGFARLGDLALAPTEFAKLGVAVRQFPTGAVGRRLQLLGQFH